MIDGFLAELGYFGQYVAIWKIVTFLGLFGLWAWVGQWLDKDTLAVVYAVRGTVLTLLVVIFMIRIERRKKQRRNERFEGAT